jgi:hypothetical protein
MRQVPATEVMRRSALKARAAIAAAANTELAGSPRVGP